MSRPDTLIFLLLLGLASTAECRTLGRLFFTPQQRQQITQSPNHPNSPQLNGIVQKHGGPRTVWLDGTMYLTPTGKSTDSDTPIPSDRTLRLQQVGTRIR